MRYYESVQECFDPNRDARERAAELQRRRSMPYNPDPMRSQEPANLSSSTGRFPYGS